MIPTTFVTPHCGVEIQYLPFMVDGLLNRSYYVYYRLDDKVQSKDWDGCKIPPDKCATVWYNGTNHFNEMVINDDFRDFLPEPVLDESSFPDNESFIPDTVQTPKKSNVSANMQSNVLSNVLSNVSNVCRQRLPSVDDDTLSRFSGSCEDSLSKFSYGEVPGREGVSQDLASYDEYLIHDTSVSSLETAKPKLKLHSFTFTLSSPEKK